jgi:hypothetical protein
MTQSHIAVNLHGTLRMLFAHRRNALFVEVDASLAGNCSASIIKAKMMRSRLTMALLLVSPEEIPLVAQTYAMRAY